MATYISLVNYTDQGIRNIKDSPKRLDAAKKMLKDMGGELKQFYLTMGSHDIVAVVEAPSDETVAKVVVMLAADVNGRTSRQMAVTAAVNPTLISTLPGSRESLYIALLDDRAR